MRRIIIFPVLVALFASTAGAEPPPVTTSAPMKNPFPHYNAAPASRQEAIQRTQERLSVLQGMSDAQWTQWQQQQQARRQKMQQARQQRQQQRQARQAVEAGKNISPIAREKARNEFKE